MNTESIRKFEYVFEIVERNERNPGRLIPILQAVQEQYRYLPEEILTLVATALGPLACQGIRRGNILLAFHPDPQG